MQTAKKMISFILRCLCMNLCRLKRPSLLLKLWGEITHNLNRNRPYYLLAPDSVYLHETHLFTNNWSRRCVSLLFDEALQVQHVDFPQNGVAAKRLAFCIIVMNDIINLICLLRPRTQLALHLICKIATRLCSCPTFICFWQYLEIGACDFLQIQDNLSAHLINIVNISGQPS